MTRYGIPQEGTAADAQKEHEYRNYKDSARQTTVSNFYKINHINQTYDFVLAKKKEILTFNTLKMSMWEACLKLDTLVDDSDPDTENAQIVHLVQTAEALRLAYPGEEYDWLHLVGFIHDLGKILALPPFNQEQWCVVGDTFPVGCAPQSALVFHQYFEENPDVKHPVYGTKLGVYKEGCGFDNMQLSFGHDEYMYQVCKHNGSTLPPQALYIIRYHSFYGWHQGGAYSEFASDEDRENLKWLRLFQKCDLYSKLPEKPNMEKCLIYYKGLLEKYFPPTLDW